MSMVILLRRKPHWLSGCSHSATIEILSSTTRARSLSATDSSDIQRCELQSALSPFLLYRSTMMASLKFCGTVSCVHILRNSLCRSRSSPFPPRLNISGLKPSEPGAFPHLRAMIAFLGAMHLHA